MNHNSICSFFLAVILCILLSLISCGTLPNGRGWGQDATLFPGWCRIGDAAFNAATATETWVPFAGAMILQVDGMDKRLSNYASSHTPVFGTQRAADDASSYLNSSTRWAYITTLLVTPSGEKPGDWTLAKIKGLAVGTVALSTNTLATNGLKKATGRSRPDASDNASFPSLTTSDASIQATLASKNLDSIPIDEGSRSGLRYGFFALTTATGWARIEADKHYPSDVLVGAAIGHFFGVFFNDAFLGTKNSKDMTLQVFPSYNGFMARIQWQY